MMKRNDRGISMVSLVSTIIVIIGLAVVLYETYTLYEEICPHGDADCVYCGQSEKQGTAVAIKSITEVAKVGDYVRYEANGITNWRVFDIQNGEVIITPESGGVGELTLSGAADYANAVSILEDRCDDFTNSSLGITTSNVRSMTVEDINRVTGYMSSATTTRYEYYLDGTGYMPSATITRYAYYLDGDSSYTSGTLTYNGESYIKAKHHSSLHNNWITPRFYTWDYANPTNITEDENGNLYAYPTENNPVYVTHYYYWYDPSEYTHKKNSSINVGSLLGMDVGWLASPCVCADSYKADFCMYFAYFDVVYTYYVANSYGDSFSTTCGVRPLVFLNSEIQATGTGASDSPWVLSK